MTQAHNNNRNTNMKRYLLTSSGLQNIGRVATHFGGSTPIIPLLLSPVPPPFPIYTSTPLPICASPQPPPNICPTNGPKEEVAPQRDLGSCLDQHIDYILISRYFMEVLRTPSKSKCKGITCHFSLIRVVLRNILHDKIKQVVSETAICELKGETYNGLRKNGEHIETYLIPPANVHERIMCDCIETGLGMKHTTLLLNNEL